MRVARQAIKLRDHKLGTIDTAGLEGVGQLWPVILALAGFDFGEFAGQLPRSTVQEHLDGFALGVEPEAAASLLLGRNAIVGDERHGVSPCQQAAKRDSDFTDPAFGFVHSNFFCDFVSLPARTENVRQSPREV